MDSTYFKRASLGNESQLSDQDLLKAQDHVWNHMFNFINTISLKCAIDLAIPETIHNHGKPMTLPELVAKLPIHPSKARHVHRLMRVLSHLGFFALQKFGHDQEGYVPTLASHLLLRDNPFSVAPLFLTVLDPRFTKPYQHLTEWFQNDDLTPFSTAHGMAYWEYMPREPEFCSFTNDAMARDTKLTARVVTSAFKGVFEGVKTLVDVGGNTGTLARGIANAFPNLECTVFDRPHMVAGLEGTKNLKFVGGNMFEAIPPADAILLKWLLIDWSDEDCVKILEQCKKAILSSGANRGKVIIIDMVVGNHGHKDEKSLGTQLCFDIFTMAVVSGKQRNEQEWAELFSSAGFRDYKIIPGLGLKSLIEVYP